jgi:hypothetical protein
MHRKDFLPTRMTTERWGYCKMPKKQTLRISPDTTYLLPVVGIEIGILMAVSDAINETGRQINETHNSI